MRKSPSLSVLIDTYNHEKYIGAAIESVLAQEEIANDTFEIIVIDDGSNDRTGEIVRSFGNRLQYYYKPNGGQASAFNFGIPLCQGEIICFLDGDDWWHPNKLNRVSEAFRIEPATCAVGHAIVEVDEVDGMSYTIGPSAPIAINFSSPGSITLFRKFACCLGTSRLAVRRSAALALLNIPEALVFEADEYMFTLLPTLGDATVLPEALTYYRIHGANLFHGSRAVPLKHRKDSRLFKRASIYGCLSKELPVELRKRGCDRSVINLIVGPIEVEASRLKLMAYGGTPLENFRSERRAAEHCERNRSAFSRIVLWISLALTLALPPKWYFKVKETYSNLLRAIARRV